jgi:hypothetical protein
MNASLATGIISYRNCKPMELCRVQRSSRISPRMSACRTLPPADMGRAAIPRGYKPVFPGLIRQRGPRPTWMSALARMRQLTLPGMLIRYAKLLPDRSSLPVARG